MQRHRPKTNKVGGFSMPKKRAAQLEMTHNIAKNLMQVIPLMRKKLLYIDALQKEHGLTFSHLQILLTLHDTGALPIGDISKRLGIAKPNITPLVDKLLQLRYVSRQRDLSDRRVVLVLLEAEGIATLNEIEATLAEQLACRINSISAADLRELDQSLSCLRRVFASI